MYPTLKDGEYVIIQRDNNGNLTNEIVYYPKGKLYIIHRVIEEKDGFVLTKGDANEFSDRWIPREAIRGKVIFVLPFWFFDSLSIIGLVILNLVFLLILIKLRRKKPSALNRERKNA